MIAQVVLDETGHEVITVVVTGLATQRQGVAAGLGAGPEHLGLELQINKFVILPLVHQDGQTLAVLAAGGGDQRAGIPGLPGCVIVSQQVGEGLLPPGAADRIANGRKGRDRPGLRSAQTIAP